jgi:hypothetical protein
MGTGKGTGKDRRREDISAPWLGSLPVPVPVPVPLSVSSPVPVPLSVSSPVPVPVPEVFSRAFVSSSPARAPTPARVLFSPSP